MSKYKSHPEKVIPSNSFDLTATPEITYVHLNVSTIPVDSTPPEVTINSPTATTYTSSSYSINITLNEAGYCLVVLVNGDRERIIVALNSPSKEANFYDIKKLINVTK